MSDSDEYFMSDEDVSSDFEMDSPVVIKPKKVQPAAKKIVASKAKINKAIAEKENNNNTETNGEERGKTGDKNASKTYKKLTPREHALHRPDMFIGSIEHRQEKIWVYDEGVGMNCREVDYIPGLYKIFDEILVNAADHKQRDDSMTSIKVEIDPSENMISVWNNGQGIPIVIHEEEKIYIPEMIFGHLLTSSNYDDNEEKVTGGRNGYGAKLANIFSTKFILETVNTDNQKRYKQIWTENMKFAGKAKIDNVKPSVQSYTKVTFYPDLERFSLKSLDGDTVALLTKRVYDVAGCNPQLKVTLNGNLIKINNFSDYCKLYLKEGTKFEYMKVNDRWHVCVAMSEGQMEQVSFVNSISTIRGGTHVDTVANQIGNYLKDVINKKQKKGKKSEIKLNQVKQYLWVFVNSLIVNPAFDSQTKETLTTKVSKFGSKVNLPDSYLKKIEKLGIVDNVMSWMMFKETNALKRKGGKKTERLVGIKKLCDANDAGNKRFSGDCTLILTEGDSAKTLAISGLSVVGRDRFGVFPLKGKLLNVRDASSKQVMDNEEINNIKKILGLQHGKVYDSEQVKKQLRYGKLMIMADQDHDGSHIKGLIINFIHKFWPSLLQTPGFLQEFVTPIVKATKGKQQISFFTMPEYENWKEEMNGAPGWKIRYYKGLGTSTAQEAKEYFKNIKKHRIEFRNDSQSGELIDMAFSKKKADDRKKWILSINPETTFVDHSKPTLTYSDFVNKELVLFSQADCERSIPSMIDGLKPGQRKILFSCFKRKLTQDIKVAQLAGYVAEQSAYHHGEASLMATIINMAQNYVGSNNINLLFPSGQFGTRLMGGKDAASPRYIFTRLENIARKLFNETDDHLLQYLDDDGLSIEPKWYLPIIPTILVNGAEGIGTGWSTTVPCFDPRDIVENLQRLLDGQEPVEMLPWYRGFEGTIEKTSKGASFDVTGCYQVIDDNTIRITELPIGTWTQSYKNFLESILVDAPGTTGERMISDYRDNCGDTTVDFTVTFIEGKLEPLLENDGKLLLQKMKLQTKPFHCSNMNLFNADGIIKKYDTVQDILQEFYELRLSYYHNRREYLIKHKRDEVKKISNKVRFILGVVEGEIVLANKRKASLLQELEDKGFDKMSKVSKKPKAKNAIVTEEEHEESSASYDYLLSMPLWNLTLEQVEKLKGECDQRQKELEALLSTPKEQMWNEDLDQFLVSLEEFENSVEKKAVRPVKKKIIREDDFDDYVPGAASKRPPKKESKPQAKKPVKKPISLDSRESSEAEDSDEEMVSSVSKKATAKKPAAKKAPALKVAPVKKTASKKSVLGDSKQDIQSFFKPETGKRKSEKPATTQKRAKTNAAPSVLDISDSDSDSDLEFLSGQLTETAARKLSLPPSPTPVKSKSMFTLPSDSEDEKESSEKAPTKRAPRVAAVKSKSRIIEGSSEDQDDSDESEDMKPAKSNAAKKKAPAKKVPAKKAPAKKNQRILDDSSEDQSDMEDSDEVVVKKAPANEAPRGRPVRAAAKAAVQTLEAIEDSPVTPKAKRKPKHVIDSSDESFEDEESNDESFMDDDESY